MIRDLEGEELAPPRPRTWSVLAAATLAAVMIGGDARAPGDRLALPAAARDVELAWLPDRLVNESPRASLQVSVRVRGTLGIASIDAPWMVVWTERGVSYQLSSSERGPDDLVRVAAALRPPTR